MPEAQIKREASSGSQPSKTSETRKPFDIDNYLNPYIPRSPLHLLPTWMSYFFGYRPPRSGNPSQPAIRRHHDLIVYASISIGTFCGLTIVQNTFLALPPLSGHAVPIIIASYGAAAILEYNTIESPLAQPRNLIFGHFLSALTAVCITKLFEHLRPHQFDELRWLAGAISVAVASMIMSFTKTVHPPAGATALLASTNVEIQVLGWWLLPLVLLASTLMLASAMITNNLAGRRYPVYWWTPVNLKALGEERRQAKDEKQAVDLEKASNPSTSSESEGNSAELDEEVTETGSNADDLRKASTQDADRLGRQISYTSASREPHFMRSRSEKRSQSATSHPTRADLKEQNRTEGEGEGGDPKGDRITITNHEIIVPDWFQLNDWEDEVLRILMERLRDT